MTFKLIKAGVAAFALLAIPFAAQAADVPIKAPYYKGHALGRVLLQLDRLLRRRQRRLRLRHFGLVGASGHSTIKPKGFLAGGTVGYNWQSGAIVYGIEGDFDWSNVKDSVACGGRRATCETSSSWLATFRGRVGYAFDRWLPYVTGGGAYGNVKATVSVAGGLAVSTSSSQLGWTVGAGLEYAFMGNWTAKLEYLYVDLGSFNSGIAPAS